MPIVSAITSVFVWGGSLMAVVKPFIPGIVAISGWTLGSHFAAFGGSWWAARTYSINCVGEGFRGFLKSYWTIGSPTCTTLLFTHVSLLAVAITSVLATVMIFFWVWYKMIKVVVGPISNEMKAEFNAHRMKSTHGPLTESKKSATEQLKTNI